jgi:hypothetical protein
VGAQFLKDVDGILNYNNSGMIVSVNLTFWGRIFFFQILAHPVFKNVSNTETKQGSIMK